MILQISSVVGSRVRMAVLYRLLHQKQLTTITIVFTFYVINYNYITYSGFHN